jgi:hypothetical protein
MSHKPDLDLEKAVPQNPESSEPSCTSRLFLLADCGALGPVEVELVDHPVTMEDLPVRALVADSQCEV